MSKKTFILSCEGLQNVIFMNFNDEDIFHFIIGENDIEMNRFFADFISPRVSRLHQSDPTINSLYLNDYIQASEKIAEITSDSGLINNFRQISKGYSIEINEDMSHKMRILSILIENKELYEKMNELFPISTTEANLDSCLQYLQYFDTYKNNDFFYQTISNQAIFDLIASHFYTIEKTKLLKLPKTILYSILSNKNLILKNEDSLLDFIDQIFANPKSNKNDFLPKLSFYELIEFESLSDKKFNELVDNIKLNEMTHLLWEKFRECLHHQFANSMKNDNETRYLDKIIKKDKMKCITNEFNNDLGNRFTGIVFQLGNGDPKSVIEEELMNVTASSFYSHNYPKNAVDFDDHFSTFQSSNKADSWLCYDFKEARVKPSFYSLRSNSLGGKGWFHPRSWCIEGSNDQKKWKILDLRSGEESLNNKNAANTFKIQNILGKDEFYRFLRIRQTDMNTKNNNCLIIAALEFFGTILVPE